ncbi:acyl-CoA synthetase [Sphingosinithalassobacter sp. LHW66-3]|uniref:acyl-CoA synthetase n=1 Tax=Sphingosinithalassobacter sp. LHW66-3 TaxID=3424718 RepID=UPI003D6B5CB1
MHPRHFAASDPARAAVIVAETGTRLSFEALERRANQGAHRLRGDGLRAGDAVAAWLPNGIAFFELFWAAQRAGLYFVPVSTALTAEEAVYILADSGARVLVVSPEVAGAAGIAEQLPDGVRAIYAAGGALAGAESWSAALDACPDTPIADETAGTHMVYSSGTTGRPKGIRLPLTGGAAEEPHPLAAFLQMRFGLTERDVLLTPAPLYHTAPLAFSTGMQRLGGTVVVLRKFDAEAALRAIEEHRVTFTQMVPTMFARLLRLPEEARARHDLSSLRHLVHAAAPCPIPVKRAMIDWLGPIISEYYAGSENNGATFITSEEWLAKPGSVGRSTTAIVHICGEDGAELPPGAPGLVYFESTVPFAYHNDPEKTASVRHPEHPSWSTLGDIGFLDEDGYLFLTDRASFLIISGGVNIYPQETENLLLTHPKVADAAVIGVPDAEMGEQVKAVIEPVDWGDATPDFAEELIGWCRERLSHVKCPKSIDFERALPRHDTGKLYKRKLRDRYWQAAEAE